MKSPRQRRVELKAARARKRAKKQAVAMGYLLENRAPVNHSLLAPSNSYGRPDFYERGYYVDKAFTCKDCGRKEVWSSTQQKWWYEVAKGDVFTEARRCRPCRIKERQRIKDARRVHLEGLAATRRQARRTRIR